MSSLQLPGSQGGSTVITVLTMTCYLALLVSSQQNAPGYIGCFVDVNSDRALRTEKLEDDDQSVDWCFKYCLDTLPDSYKYLGLEYSDECFCGNNEDYGRHGKSPDSDCDYDCDGNSNQICGASHRISIYRISQGVCGNDIGPPTNGTHTINNPRLLYYNLNNFKFFGTRVDFYCDTGYTLQGASSIQCIETGNNNVTWSNSVPTCDAPRPTTVVMTTLPTTTLPASSPSETDSTTTTYTTIDGETSWAPTGYNGSKQTSESNGPITGQLQTDTTSGKASRTPPTSSSTRAFGTNSPITGQLETGTIVGIAVGLVVALSVLVAVVILLRRKGINKEEQLSDVAMDTMESRYSHNSFTNQLNSDVATEPNQSAPPMYSQVIRKPKKPTSDDVYATDVTTTCDDEDTTKNQHNIGKLLESSQDDPETGWVDNTLYGCELFPVEAEASTNGSDKQTSPTPAIAMPGWVENIIYE